MRTRLNRTLIILMLLSLFSACKTELVYPLCPRLANSKPSIQKNVGETLYNFCKRRNIKIMALSDNIAQFSGSRQAMKELQQTFHILVCDFDQSLKATDESGKVFDATTNIQCITNLQNWIEKTRQQPIGNLLNEGDNYCQTCMSSLKCH